LHRVVTFGDAIGNGALLEEDTTMAWTTPEFVEIAASAEVTAYVYSK